MAKVDCTTERSICERFSVNSYPTLKVVSNGKYYDYPGARDADPMVDFVLTGYKVGRELFRHAVDVAAR